MGSLKDHHIRNGFKGETYAKGLDRMEKINDKGGNGDGNPHDKWKEQIISDIIILAIFIGLVVFIFSR